MELKSGEKRIRRTFDKEFKISAVKMVIEGKESLMQVAKDLGISDNTLRNWKNAFERDKTSIVQGKENQKPEDAEITALRKELAKTKEQRDILKKAVAFFSQYEK